jgi:hypothetical protein
MEQRPEPVETIIMPIVGYRVWEVDGANLLYSHLFNNHWPVRKKMVATCQFGLGACWPPTTESGIVQGFFGLHSGESYHRCGIYAFKTEAQLNDYLRDVEEKSRGFLPDMYAGPEDIVLGTVYLWGKVTECSNGYRAEFAYPKELYESAWSALTGNRRARIAELYGLS